MPLQRSQIQPKEKARQSKAAQANQEFKKSDWGMEYAPGFLSRSGAFPSDLPRAPQSISFLQHTLGNRTLGRMIQAKLTIGQPDDQYEREADRVAEQVMRMPEPLANGREDDEEQIVQTKPIAGQISLLVQRQVDEEEEEPLQAKALSSAPHLQRKCPACESGGESCPKCAEEEMMQRKPLTATITPLVQRQSEMPEDDETLQTKAVSPHTPQVTPKTSANINAMRGNGQPLPASSRAFFEPRFGVDFSGVRVHTDGRAAETAKLVNARAFTVGSDMAFGGGQYSPESSVGKKLLAHELTHVVQQQNRNKAINPLFKSRFGSVAPLETGCDAIIQLSPLSDELSQLWASRSKGEFFRRLRAVGASHDVDVLSFIRGTLQGDDLWLAQNLVIYGPEISWPIHLRIEREMKGWGDSRGRGEVFNILRAANGSSAQSSLLTATLRRAFATSPDDLWLAETLQQYGPEPLWPAALIDRRIELANDPAHPWAHEPGNIEGFLTDPGRTDTGPGMTAGIPNAPQSPIPPSPIRAYFFPGRTSDRALIIGGVHGSEQSGIEVVERLRTSLAAAARPPLFTTILVPVLFPDNREYDNQYRALHANVQRTNVPNELGGRYSRVPTATGGIMQVEPNRNFPLPGQSLSTAMRSGLRSVDNPSALLQGNLLISQLLPETRMLLALIERFRPHRIASVHSHRPSTRPGDAPGIFVDPRGGIDRGTRRTPRDVARTPEGQADDDLAREMLTYARGQRARIGVPDRDNPGETVHYRASHPSGTSLGDWAPVPIDEGELGVEDMPGDRPAITIITVEVEDYFPSREDPTGEMGRRIDIHRDTLLEVFLNRPEALPHT